MRDIVTKTREFYVPILECQLPSLLAGNIQILIKVMVNSENKREVCNYDKFWDKAV